MGFFNLLGGLRKPIVHGGEIFGTLRKGGEILNVADEKLFCTATVTRKVPTKIQKVSRVDLKASMVTPRKKGS